MPVARLTSWQRVALQLGAVISRDRLHGAVVREADASDRRRWIVAVSGGADSVALVLLVWAHWPERRDRLVLAHFNHRLRGKESTADARFCALLARGLGIEYASDRWENRPAEISEAVAREARNTFLETVRKSYRSRLIWTGHQQDDVAESMLMRLARGSGTAGLAAPRPVQDWARKGLRLRPLLSVSRAELRETLTTVGGRWREDESNQGESYFRNRLRKHVIPSWLDAAGRDALGGAATSRERLEEDDDALEAWLAEIAPFAPDGSLALKALEGRPIALWRRALHRWLLAQADRGDLSRRGFQQLLELAQQGGTCRFSLGKTGFVKIRRGRLCFEKLSR
jgi:tRNA(Ile)-lysidine synthase